MNIATIVGARPQFVKAAGLARAFRAIGIEEEMIHTGQHYDDNMSGVFFKELDIHPPQHELGIGSGSHGAQTGRMLEAIERVLQEMEPDCVVVYGDTNSTLAGALAATKLHIPVAHVEAGLRSFNRGMPEEINRVVTDHLSDFLFAPTDTSVRNLLAEGVPKERAYLVGDVMYDAVLHYGAEAEAHSGVLEKFGLQRGSYLLATLHRAENTDNVDRLRIILNALGEMASEFPVLLPLHPRTRKVLQDSGDTADAARRLLLTPPVGYLDMLMLEKNARLIATDSGGVQKEAYFHQVPCVTLRHETEWVELVELGWNMLVPPTSTEEMTRGLRRALHMPRRLAASLYGDGHSCEKIAHILAEQLPLGPSQPNVHLALQGNQLRCG